MEQSVICRVCMDDDGENFTSVFTATESTTTTAAVMIVDCTGVKVDKDDGMPEMICNKCLCAIREAYKIRSKCRNTDRKLRKILNLGIKPSVEKEVGQISVREIATQTVEILLESPVEELQLRSEQSSSILPEMVEQPTAETIENPTFEQMPVIMVKQEKSQSDTQVYDTEYLVEELKECAGEEPELEPIEEPDQEVRKQCETVLVEDNNDKHCIKIEVETLDELEYENYEAIDDDEDILQSVEPAAETASDEIVCCCGCPCEFKSVAELKVHSEQLHFEIGAGSGILNELTCEICFKEHPSLKTLAHHKANRYNRAQRSCGICRIVLPNVRKKKQHESLHKSLPNGFQIKCCGCSQLIPFDQLGLHTEQVHQAEGRVYASKFICDMCFMDCGSRQQLESHQTKYEAYIQQNKLVKPVPFDDKLGIVFLDADGKQRFVCDICEKTFATKGNLKSHRTLHDASQKPVFKCTLCDPPRDFSKKNNYNVHMIRTHSTERLYCPDCGKSFKCSINLKTHMRVHTKERPYLCGYCSKTFAHLSDKRRHEITHTHQYPFRCDRCSKPFTRKTVLDRHLESCGQRINKRFMDSLKSHDKHLQQQQQQDPIDFLLPTDMQTLEEGTYETEVEIE